MENVRIFFEKFSARLAKLQSTSLEELFEEKCFLKKSIIL